MPETAKQTAASIQYLPEQGEIICSGDWTTHQISKVELSLVQILKKIGKTVSLSAKQIDKVDSAGAVLLFELLESLKKSGCTVKIKSLSPACLSLLGLVKAKKDAIEGKVKRRRLPNFLAELGEQAVKKLTEALKFLAYIGRFAESIAHLLRSFRNPPWKSVFVTVDESGYQALPIVGLLTFLVGVVVTFQMAMQLESYGASIFIVDIGGLIILREFGPLITAIIAAGRTSTAFTAQIGTMKVNEELDALNTMGVSPMERLVIPKVIGLIIALPLLTVWADVFGVLGSLLMSSAKLGISPAVYIDRFQRVVSVKQFVVGMVKVPVFAMLIALVGCFQGFCVQKSADDVGRKTTRSAVQSIFLVIIADAIFSVIFSIRGI